jgi:hypothetical protein
VYGKANGSLVLKPRSWWGREHVSHGVHKPFNTNKAHKIITGARKRTYIFSWEQKVAAQERIVMPQKMTSKHPAVVPIQTADKTFNTDVTTDPPQDHPCSMPRGSHIAVVADPGRGKTSTILNCLVRGEKWAAIFVIHGASDSQEYSSVAAVWLHLEDHTKRDRGAQKPPFSLGNPDIASPNLRNP